MKLVQIVFGVALLANSTAPAFAADWIHLSKSTRGDRFSVDASSITLTSDGRRAWSKTLYRPPYEDGRAQDIVLSIYDCTNRTIGMISRTIYAADGRSLRSTTVRDFLIERNPVVPDSVGETELGFVCTYPIGAHWSEIGGLELEVERIQPSTMTAPRRPTWQRARRRIPMKK